MCISFIIKSSVHSKLNNWYLNLLIYLFTTTINESPSTNHAKSNLIVYKFIPIRLPDLTGTIRIPDTRIHNFPQRTITRYSFARPINTYSHFAWYPNRPRRSGAFTPPQLLKPIDSRTATTTTTATAPARASLSYAEISSASVTALEPSRATGLINSKEARCSRHMHTCA